VTKAVPPFPSERIMAANGGCEDHITSDPAGRRERTR
jgi:hypothetical protein